MRLPLGLSCPIPLLHSVRSCNPNLFLHFQSLLYNCYPTIEPHMFISGCEWVCVSVTIQHTAHEIKLVLSKLGSLGKHLEIGAMSVFISCFYFCTLRKRFWVIVVMFCLLLFCNFVFEIFGGCTLLILEETVCFANHFSKLINVDFSLLDREMCELLFHTLHEKCSKRKHIPSCIPSQFFIATCKAVLS